jgi:hypothetical protein
VTDRRDTVVTTQRYNDAEPPQAVRRDGKSSPVQVGTDGRFSFLLDDLKKDHGLPTN